MNDRIITLTQGFGYGIAVDLLHVGCHCEKCTQYKDFVNSSVNMYPYDTFFIK
jgi:hypothetical protein